MGRLFPLKEKIDMTFRLPTKAQVIAYLIWHRDEDMTAGDLAQSLFGSADEAGKVRQDCGWLVEEDYLNRDDSKPMRYSKGRRKPGTDEND